MRNTTLRCADATRNTVNLVESRTNKGRGEERTNGVDLAVHFINSLAYPSFLRVVEQRSGETDRVGKSEALPTLPA